MDVLDDIYKKVKTKLEKKVKFIRNWKNWNQKLIGFVIHI